jgi:hypothetical protein
MQGLRTYTATPPTFSEYLALKQSIETTAAALTQLRDTLSTAQGTRRAAQTVGDETVIETADKEIGVLLRELEGLEARDAALIAEIGALLLSLGEERKRGWVGRVRGERG